MSRQGTGASNGAFERDQQTHTLESIAEVPRRELHFIDDDEESESFSDKYSTHIRCVKIIVINGIVGAYFAWATYHFFNKKLSESECSSMWCDGYGMLALLMIFVYTCLIYFNVLKPLLGRCISTSIRPYKRQISATFQKSKFLKVAFVVVILLIFAVCIGIDTYKSPERLQSLLGIVILLSIGFAFSKHRSQINWRPVIFGVILQFILGLFCIRIEIGRKIFVCLGEKVAVFFSFAKHGAKFVYGADLVETAKVFAFSILPVIFFFSFIISILYYYGAMQWIIKKMGDMLQSILGTTMCESVTVAANIFLGMTESPLIIQPYIKYLTASEIHVIMSSGFATVSGTVLAAYMDFGASASHLITSSVMAAPATLAFSKLIYPETEISQTSSKTFKMEKSTENSVLDAAANGAFAAISLIGGIIANLVAFVSFVAFMNGIVGWLSLLVGYDGITIEWFFGKLFIPLAYIIGIPWKDCEKVGEVIALKNIANEFVAYERLGKLKAANEISLRSSAITTFAICGFANLGSLGMMIGNLGAMCPENRSVITSVAVRALISGSIICFINASIAGLLMTDDISTA
ncbi:uncharacterized protein LOC116341962 [Contarinia nasturtii]|uniref:uncharacterized protein LOC116341962 n=1 Tax=Contarinia nasturtii TaxID=265458 RepID=UPI0012D4C14A|nr:uncharacterized protein LOC116341962 [Contarinia nasturtii]XP_031625264.1 uncharacterized protein LOC116341962 [Contarinia nasturtii]